MTTTPNTTHPNLTGKVKWFNNKAGFGFITVCDYDGEHSGKDIFVHYTSIGVKNNQYKYLVQGEYVDFALAPLEESPHPFHAIDVCGIKGGSLMCETRKQTSQERMTRIVSNTGEVDGVRGNTVEPSSKEVEGKEVTTDVRKRRAPRKTADSIVPSERPTKKTVKYSGNSEKSSSVVVKEGDSEFKLVARRKSAKTNVKSSNSKPVKYSSVETK